MSKNSERKARRYGVMESYGVKSSFPFIRVSKDMSNWQRMTRQAKAKHGMGAR